MTLAGPGGVTDVTEVPDVLTVHIQDCRAGTGAEYKVASWADGIGFDDDGRWAMVASV